MLYDGRLYGGAVLESVFQALFTYRPIVFEQGAFRFDPSTGSWVAAVAGLLAAVAAVATYRRAAAAASPRTRATLLALRLLLIALVVVCLFRPVIVVKTAVPQQNVLAVLLDDSRSMQVPDWHGQPRGAFEDTQLGGPDRPLLKALSSRFLIRTFHVSSTATRADAESGLTFAGTQTRLGESLDAARQELAGLPVSGLVLVSDGADTSEAALAPALLALKAEKLPVYTVGVGRPQLEKDLQVDRVNAPATVLAGSALLVDVTLSHTGLAGQTATVDVEDEGRVVGTARVALGADGAPATVRLRVTAAEPGPRLYRFRAGVMPGEVVTENNTREATVLVTNAREKILYYEGEPRFEMKFIRRAVADDKNLQLVTLQRTADNKYLRLDVDGPEELAAGFPKTREELFAYRALVLGSVEAGAFSPDQLRMIAEFVDTRGGGLLVLGGGRSFAQGAWTGTPVADALPVPLERPPAGEPPLLRIRVQPTREGAEHAVTQIAETPQASMKRWSELPQVTTVNALSAVKPGATVLLTGTDERNHPQVVLASQPYGRGKVLAFTPQDSWLWQMHASIPLEDQTHENLWRQMLRWLVDGVPGPVSLHLSSEQVQPGDPVTVEATVADRIYVPVADAQVMAHVTASDGTVEDVTLTPTGTRAGQYRGTFAARARGRYDVRVEARRGGETLGTALGEVVSGPSLAEYFNAGLREQTLRRIAADTGGRYYEADHVEGLIEDVRYGGRGVTSAEEREVWHLPIVLLVLFGLAFAEWGVRRSAGLA